MNDYASLFNLLKHRFLTKITMLTMTLDGFTTKLDGWLRPICEKLQLGESRHEMADSRYKSVGDWLDCEGSSLKQFQPSIYPQGSLAIGTTVKPLTRQEFDLDFVLELQLNLDYFRNPILLLNLLEARLREHRTYAGMLERKNRCVRLIYADDFYMDILPAVPAGCGSEGCLKVPDRKAQGWKDSNPKGFVYWFNSRGRIIHTDSRQQAPLPAHETLDEKSTLQCAVQLLKRWRDIYFIEMQDLAPVSIVLTTLAGRHYQGEESVEEAVTGILDGILRDIARCVPGQRLVVLNPANLEEDLSERWNELRSYKAFIEGIKQLQCDWQVLCSTSGIDNICTMLKTLFGEQPTNEVFAERARRFESNRKLGNAAVITGAGSIAVRPHTFFGNGN
jgi:hypothetical protein